MFCGPCFVRLILFFKANVGKVDNHSVQLGTCLGVYQVQPSTRFGVPDLFLTGVTVCSFALVFFALNTFDPVHDDGGPAR